MRLGLIELIFREVEEYLRKEHEANDLNMIASILSKRIKPKSKSSIEIALINFIASVDELNARFREANTPFTYHNGYIQLIEDTLTDQEIEKPFWQLVSDPKWKNVDYEMKEPLDMRDAGKEDAVTYALQALESTVKIISDGKRWTTGRETGAFNYIDNLVSTKNGCYIDKWEAETIKYLFSTLRNPRSHGAGSGPRPESHEHQRVWAIETCMSWIKSLIKRF
jgi:AbiJ N-terminal domain 4